MTYEELNKPRWKIGDRVQRRADVFNSKSKLMRGQVVNVRLNERGRFGFYPELYDVQFDGEPTVSRSFLPHGLHPESDVED